MRKIIAATVMMSFSFALIAAFVQAQDEEGFILYRQKVMRAHSAHMGAIGDIMKYKLPDAGKLIASHARALSEASTLIEAAFTKKVTSGKTDAKAEIWGEWDEFLVAAKKLQQESSRLAGLAEGANMRTLLEQVKKVRDGCGGCHEPYRKPKEESYRQAGD